MVVGAVVTLAIGLVVKRAVIGTYKEGEYRVWSNHGMCHQVLGPSIMAADALIVGTLHGTPWLNLWFRLLGAKIGSNVQIYGSIGHVADLIEIGDNVVIEIGAGVSPVTHSDDGLVPHTEQHTPAHPRMRAHAYKPPVRPYILGK